MGRDTAKLKLIGCLTLAYVKWSVRGFLHKKYPTKTIVNILILIFIGWPVAGFAAWIYIFISPFAACLGSGKLRMMRNHELTKAFIGCDKISDFCQKGVEWPRALGKAIKDGDSSFGC